MKIKKYFRRGKIMKGVEVTKEELFKLKENNSFIRITEADLNNLNNLSNRDNLDIVGAIFGDIGNLKDISDSWVDLNSERVVKPNCWFVYQPENHGYKDLNAENLTFTFSEAKELLKRGYKVARKGWNGMWLVLQPHTIKAAIKADSACKNAGLDEAQIDAHIDMYTAQGTMRSGWLASQADKLSEDWVIVN